ncbi:MAG: 4a-hydroxytetrahydrobiopterin dehydratase [Pseudomonadota bacterium]
MNQLFDKSCTPCEGGVAPLTPSQCAELLPQIPGWNLVEEKVLEREFGFDNYWQTMAFVNAVAWVAHREDHHPDLTVSYSSCRIHYTTHAIGGLSENDFICAAKINRLGTAEDPGTG